MSESAAHGIIESNGRRTDDDESVSFSDVARAHYRWDVAAKGTETRDKARADFHDKLALFERQTGADLVDAYWCRKEASAVALTQARTRPPGRLHRLVGWDEVPELHLYRVTDWVTGGQRKLADLLHDCDILAIKATWGLEGLQRAVVMQWLLAVEAHILGFIESDWRAHAEARTHEPEPPATDGLPNAKATEVSRALERQRRLEERERAAEAAARVDSFYLRTRSELSRIEDYYQAAGEKRARLRYVEGMLVLGTLWVVLAALLSAVVISLFGLLDLDDPGIRRFYACMGAGAVGAIISVLMRMSGHRGGWAADHELGSVGIRRLGSFRPLIGAVSGVVVALLSRTSLMPLDESELSFEFYVVVAFLAGFSERWTQVVLGGAMRTISDREPDEEPSPSLADAPVAAGTRTTSTTSTRTTTTTG
jgi:hypothetical protein